MENIDITEVVNVIVAIIGMVLLKYVIPYLKEKRLTVGNADLDYWLTIAAEATEEYFRNQISTSTEKFDYAKKILEDKGFTYDTATLQALINSKVGELFNQFKLPNEKIGSTK